MSPQKSSVEMSFWYVDAFAESFVFIRVEVDRKYIVNERNH